MSGDIVEVLYCIIHDIAYKPLNVAGIDRLERPLIMSDDGIAPTRVAGDLAEQGLGQPSSGRTTDICTGD